MYIIRVSPLGVIPPAHSEGIFSYYGKDDLSVGDIVHATIGRIKMLSIVRFTAPLASNKLALKSSSYALKRIGTVYASFTGLTPFIDIVDPIANAFFVQSGAVLKLLLPSKLLDRPELAFPVSLPASGPGHKKILCIGSETETIAYVQKEFFQKTGTLVVLAPSVGSLERIRLLMPDACVLSPALGVRTLKETLTNIRSIPQQVLLTTPAFLALLPHNTHAIVLCDAFSPHLSREESPRIHIRALVDGFARHCKLPLVLTSSHWVPDAVAYTKTAIVLSPPHQIAIINMDQEQMGEQDYVLLSRFARERIEKARHSVVVVNRKGYAPIVMCKSCGVARICEHCDAPLTAHGSSENLSFFCHHCGHKRAFSPICPECSGKDYMLYGVGVERMKEVCERLFPNSEVFALDGSQSQRTQRETVSSFLASFSAILITTEVLFEHPVTKVDCGVIASIDHIFSLPDYRTEEHAARLIMRVSDIAEHAMVQTRMPERKMWKELDTANRAFALASRSLDERNRTKLPPAIILIKCTVSDRNSSRAEEKAAQLATALTRLKVSADATQAFIAKERNFYRWNVIIRLPLKAWGDVHHPVRSLLSSLGYEWAVAVNPKSTL